MATSSDVTGVLSDWACGLRYQDIPAPVLAALTPLLLDGLANIIAGGGNAPARLQHDLIEELGGHPQATVLSTGRRTSLPWVAYLNAACANLLDFDDTYQTFAHPGVTAISPALAVAENRRISGREFLAAVVAGYETQLRVTAAALPTPQRRREIWGFGSWATVGAVFGAARAAGLDGERTRHAAGIGLFNAPVPNIPKLGLGDEPAAWAKNNYAWAAAGGTLGVLLAERGFRGNPSVLDGTGGFWAMAGSDRFDPDAALSGLGRDYLLPATSLKPYGACRWAHSALDGLAELRDRLDQGPRPTADAIEIHLFKDGADALGAREPRDMLAAQFSLPHLGALELLGRSASRGLDEADLDDPEIRAVAARITLHWDPDLDAGFYAGRMPARIVARSGVRVEEIARADARGSAGYPYGPDEAAAKFLALTEPRLGPGRAADLAGLVPRLHAVDDITELIAAAAAPG
jgi:2-methylcitrate dehydratase PrpD